MPPVLDPQNSKVDGLAFLGLSLARKSEKGHPDSVTHQTAFDLNDVLDRDYEFIFSTNDDGWLVGGGEPGPPDSFKLAAKDSSHVEIMRIGTYKKEWGGIPQEDIVAALESGEIMIPQINVLPTAVVANGDKPPELEIRFDMEPSVPDFDNLEAPLPVNWELRFIHNQLFKKFAFPSRFCPGPFHSTILRKAEFRSVAHRRKYFEKCAAAIKKWRELGPQPLNTDRVGPDGTPLPPLPEELKAEKKVEQIEDEDQEEKKEDDLGVPPPVEDQPPVGSEKDNADLPTVQDTSIEGLEKETVASESATQPTPTSPHTDVADQSEKDTSDTNMKSDPEDTPAIEDSESEQKETEATTTNAVETISPVVAKDDNGQEDEEEVEDGKTGTDMGDWTKAKSAEDEAPEDELHDTEESEPEQDKPSQQVENEDTSPVEPVIDEVTDAMDEVKIEEEGDTKDEGESTAIAPEDEAENPEQKEKDADLAAMEDEIMNSRSADVEDDASVGVDGGAVQFTPSAQDAVAAEEGMKESNPDAADLAPAEAVKPYVFVPEYSEDYSSGIWLFTDRENITNFFAPNFLPPYDTPEKKRVILDVLKEEWDEKTLSWKPCGKGGMSKKNGAELTIETAKEMIDEMVEGIYDQIQTCCTPSVSAGASSQ